jgi:hypothetical protein
MLTTVCFQFSMFNVYHPCESHLKDRTIMHEPLVSLMSGFLRPSKIAIRFGMGSAQSSASRVNFTCSTPVSGWHVPSGWGPMLGSLGSAPLATWVVWYNVMLGLTLGLTCRASETQEVCVARIKRVLRKGISASLPPSMLEGGSWRWVLTLEWACTSLV